MTCLFHLQAEPALAFNATTYSMCSDFFGCYCRGESVNLDFPLAVNLGLGCEKSPLQHGGFGCLGRLSTQVMKCLFMVMSLNPALLISATDFMYLRQRQMEMDFYTRATYICLKSINPYNRSFC